MPTKNNETTTAYYLSETEQPIHVVCNTSNNPWISYGQIMRLPLQTTCLTKDSPDTWSVKHAQINDLPRSDNETAADVVCKTCSAVVVLWLCCVRGGTTCLVHSISSAW